MVLALEEERQGMGERPLSLFFPRERIKNPEAQHQQR
jgi:hypothetical protein